MIAIFLAALALQPAVAPGAQRVDRIDCSAQPNFLTKERLPFRGSTFRFSGRMTAGELRPDNFTPLASISLLQSDRPEELSAVLSVQPITRSRYDVTLRRLINNELRERSVVGRVPTRAGVNFEIEVTADREAVFRVGNVVERVPLGDLDPDSIVLGCSSGDFRFDNLVFDGARDG